jgi:hypothetical protein
LRWGSLLGKSAILVPVVQELTTYTLAGLLEQDRPCRGISLLIGSANGVGVLALVLEVAEEREENVIRGCFSGCSSKTARSKYWTV